MGRKGIQHHADLGCGDFGQTVDLPWFTHAHFKHRPGMLPFKLKQHAGQSDQVIQVSDGFQAGSDLLHDRSQHLLTGGFTVAAGNSDQGDFITLAECQRQIAQGPQRICHGNHGQRFRVCVVGQPAGFGQGGRHSCIGNAGQESVAVKSLAAQGYKKFSRADGA